MDLNISSALNNYSANVTGTEGTSGIASFTNQLSTENTFTEDWATNVSVASIGIKNVTDTGRWTYQKDKNVRSTVTAFIMKFL